MSEYQLFLDDEQKKIILDYIKDKRSFKICCIYFLIFWLLLTLFAMLPFIVSGDVSFQKCGDFILCIIIEVILLFYLIIEGFGKDFGFNCDISCLKNDNYSLNHAEFVCRKENSTNRHPYYIYDDLNNLYICPVFLHYRNADSEDNFLYITLGNGRRYALLDN
ncbi:MAG: hypothetical protein PUH54_01725 [Oscillospiraceae bacterium]|nr:hypothetical protein [Oscillospiraceae bacterium]